MGLKCEESELLCMEQSMSEIEVSEGERAVLGLPSAATENAYECQECGEVTFLFGEHYDDDEVWMDCRFCHGKEQPRFERVPMSEVADKQVMWQLRAKIAAQLEVRDTSKDDVADILEDLARELRSGSPLVGAE